jgi:hypothetical protein
MKHILVTRGTRGTPSFVRSDLHDNKWIKHALDGNPLRAVIPTVIADIEANRGNVGVTLSTCRDGLAFLIPENASIPMGVNVTVLAPIEDHEGDAEPQMRMWSTLHWHTPDAPPSLGEKVRQSMIASWMRDIFTEAQYDAWSRPVGGFSVEVWIRPNWNISKMFPELLATTRVGQPVARGSRAVKGPAAKIKK